MPPHPLGALWGGWREVSGLVASERNPGVLWTVEDSGHPAELTAWTSQGRLLGVMALRGVQTVDAEALAPGPCPGGGLCLFAGDVGDNLRVRRAVTVHRVREPRVDQEHPPPQDVEVTSLEVTLEGGAEDVEALVVERTGNLVLFTKERSGFTRVLVAPPGGGVARERGRLDVSVTGQGALTNAVTDASLWADGTRLLVRTYGGAFEFLHPDGVLQNLAAAQRVVVPVSVDVQGESVAYVPGLPGFVHLSEGPSVPIHRVLCAHAF